MMTFEEIKAGAQNCVWFNFSQLTLNHFSTSSFLSQPVCFLLFLSLSLGDHMLRFMSCGLFYSLFTSLPRLSVSVFLHQEIVIKEKRFDFICTVFCVHLNVIIKAASQTNCAWVVLRITKTASLLAYPAYNLLLNILKTFT